MLGSTFHQSDVNYREKRPDGQIGFRFKKDKHIYLQEQISNA